MFNEDVKWSKQVQTCLKKCLRVQSKHRMFEGSKFDIGCLMKMLNGENKFNHLFKEMFEGSNLILDV